MLGGKRDSRAKWLAIAMAAWLFFIVYLTQGYAQQISPDLYKQLKFRFIGPPGNRASAVVGIPGNLLVYYVGASSGGIWKSTDGGISWDPVFDDQPAQSIGSLAIAPSDPNIVWAGTGEPWIRSNVSIGNGIYKSTDAGKTWTHMGLEKTGRIGRVAIHPRDPNIVFAAALGHCYGPQQERGVFRTTDGGKTWKQVLFVDENTGCSEIAMDPKNPRTLFAGMWPMVIRTWGRESGGPGGGLYVSRDSGTTWKRLTGHGLPESPIGKVGVAIAPSNSKCVYALIETGSPNRGTLWRSNDGGENWQLASYDRLLNERPPYASRIAVSSSNENEVYFAANSQSITLDGGKTTWTVPWSGDSHDMWVDPLNADRIMISNDGGAVITLNRSKTWNRVRLPIAQMYHAYVDNQIPYYVMGGMQDGGTNRGPSNTIGGGGGRGGGISSSNWGSTAGGESGYVIPNPVDYNIVWGGSYNGSFTVVDHRTGHRRTVQIWPESAMGSPAGLLKYRFNWTFPIAISPHDPNKVYAGSQYVHQTTDGGRSWTVISPDLSTNDQSKMGPSGGLTYDNLGVEYGCVVFAIAESPAKKRVIWAGTNDGLVHVTLDGGGYWANVTANIPNLPPWGTVSNLEPSKYDAGTCYLTVDFHQMNGRDPYVYKTTDYGKTWISISSDIPKSVFSYTHWIHEDPQRKGLLYLGTENALYVSFNDGQNWLPLQNSLPHAPVHHMVVQQQFNDLVVATYGRGFWILDDITPFQQLTPQVLNSDVHLFNLRPAYRLLSRTGGSRGAGNDQSAGNNPPYGASVNYYLKSVPKGDVKIAILDENGQAIRTLEGTKEPGINRVWWNLRHEPAREAKLRTIPPGNPHVVEEKRFRKRWEEEGWYPIEGYGLSGGFTGSLVVPGTYTVKLAVDGKEFSQKLIVKKDPASAGSVVDIRAQAKMSLEIRENINNVAGMIDQIEWMRKQIFDLKERLKGDKIAAPVLAAGDELEQKAKAVEDQLFQPIAAEGDSKSFREPHLLYEQLAVLASNVASNADFPPNKQQMEVHEVLKKRMVTYQDQFKKLISVDVPAFNKMLQEKNIPEIIIKGPSSSY
jgi:photosystem II stability/assembly factor-like uncharacterized protein